MMVSTKGRYALRVMIDLSMQDRESYVPLKEIAQRQEISEKYLEVIVKSLTRAHFIEGLRGKGGGYRLTREPDQYTVASILKITEGSLAPISCLEDEINQCHRSKKCKTLTMWQGLQDVIEDYLEGITIADLSKEDDESFDYII